MQQLGEELTNPFDNEPNDTPMTALCRVIERDLRPQLGEVDVPHMISWADTERDLTLTVVPVLDLTKKKHSEVLGFTGEVDAAPFVRALELVAGTRLDAVVKLPAKDAPLTLSVLDGKQRELDISAALASDGVPIYAWHGMNTEEFYHCIDKVRQRQRQFLAHFVGRDKRF